MWRSVHLQLRCSKVSIFAQIKAQVSALITLYTSFQCIHRPVSKHQQTVCSLLTRVMNLKHISSIYAAMLPFAARNVKGWLQAALWGASIWRRELMRWSCVLIHTYEHSVQCMKTHFECLWFPHKICQYCKRIMLQRWDTDSQWMIRRRCQIN